MKTNIGLNRWVDVFNPVYNFSHELDRVFGDWATPGAQNKPRVEFNPKTYIEEADAHYLVSLETPGVKREDIKLEITHNQMVISGERKQTPTGAQTPAEGSFGKFQRVFSLPNEVDGEKAEASYQDGVLRVSVPKAQSSKPKQIEISQGIGNLN